MHVDIIDSPTGFDEIRHNWEAVYRDDPEAQFFLSWQWLHHWLEVHPTPWFILAAKSRRTDAEYVAFLPLRLLTYFDEAAGFLHELMFGGTGFSDYAGILSLPEYEAEAMTAFAQHVRQRFAWARFTMHNLLMSDLRRRAFLAGFGDDEFAHTPIEYKNPGDPTNHGICLSIDLPASWDDYLATLSANNRQKIRRMLRKIDAAEVCRITLSDGADVEQDIATLLDFWKVKWAPSKGAENADDIARLNQAMLARCADDGRLLLPVFRHADRPVAALAVLIDRCKKSLLFFIAGRDESFREMPAGYLLHAYGIRHAIEQGFVTYDFLKGDEPYKYLFAPQQERRLQGVTVATASGTNLRGRLDPRALSAVLEQTAELHNRGEAAAAERGYRQILEVAPDDALALYRFGRLMADNGDHAAAKELFCRSLAVEPDGDNAWLGLAGSLRWLGEEEAALAACEKVLALQPQSEEARELLAQLDAATANPSAAISATLQPIMTGDVSWAPAAADTAEPRALERSLAQDIHEQIEEYLRSFVRTGSLDTSRT